MPVADSKKIFFSRSRNTKAKLHIECSIIKEKISEIRQDNHCLLNHSNTHLLRTFHDFHDSAQGIKPSNIKGKEVFNSNYTLRYVPEFRTIIVKRQIQLRQSIGGRCKQAA